MVTGISNAVGNFGSDHRLDYTVLGSPVNLAARLQATAGPGSILIAESTWLLIRDVAEATPMGELTPKGFARPVNCYRLDGLSESNSAVTRIGRHVSVNIPHRRYVRETIEELRGMEKDLARYLPND